MSQATKFFIGADQWAGLSKLMEEAGEVLQVGGKLMGTDGVEEHWDGSNLRVRLVEELGDLSAAISFFVAHSFGFDEIKAIEGRCKDKQALFLKWHHDYGGQSSKAKLEACGFESLP